MFVLFWVLTIVAPGATPAPPAADAVQYTYESSIVVGLQVARKLVRGLEPIKPDSPHAGAKEDAKCLLAVLERSAGNYALTLITRGDQYMSTALGPIFFARLTVLLEGIPAVTLQDGMTTKQLVDRVTPFRDGATGRVATTCPAGT
ncbi:MAG: hypothetical protein ACR2RB_00890 [Gammaproteobacteria bacterium]